MSVTSKATLWVSCGLCGATIFYVHYKQWLDKQKLHEGVIRDVERQQRRKIENIYLLQQQTELNRILKKQQNEDDAVAFQLLEESKKEEKAE